MTQSPFTPGMQGARVLPEKFIVLPLKDLES